MLSSYHGTGTKLTSETIDWATFAVGFLVYRDTTQSLTNATFTPLVFNTIVADVGGNFNTSNGTFTAPAKGLYQFSWQCQVSAAESIISDITVNGSTVGRGFWINGNSSLRQRGSIGSMALLLNENDVVGVRMYTSPADSLRPNMEYNWFSGALISRVP